MTRYAGSCPIGLNILFFACCSIVFFSTINALADKCSQGSHFVRAHPRSAYERADGVFVSATHVTEHCRENPPGYSFWKKHVKNLFPSDWPRKDEKSRKWSTEEIERLLDALSSLPDELLRSKIRGIFRMKRSRDFPNPASTTPGTIVLYDDAFSDKRNLARVLAHELLHEYFRGMTKNDAESYRMTTNWYRFGDADGKVRWITRGRDSFVENDGMTSPDEDFANNVEYFLFERNKLKTTTPNAEGWISRRFGPGFRLRGAK